MVLDAFSVLSEGLVKLVEALRGISAGCLNLFACVAVGRLLNCIGSS